MSSLRILIPDGVDFEDLKLTRDSVNGDISFDWSPIAKICAASGVDPDFFKKSHEDNVSQFIVIWYSEHVKNGGAKNQICESIIEEINVEDKFGIVIPNSGGLQ